jgi:uracil-DNA glycosylase
MTFATIVDLIKTDRRLGKEVPGFDPCNGNEKAKYLFLLEAPGPKAVESGRISFENPDPSAREFGKQLATAGISRSEIAIWNIVPWYIGNSDGTAIRAADGEDVREGIKYLSLLLASMPNLKCIILVGGAARRAHMFLSRLTTARIVSCHHPSIRVVNSNPLAPEENVELFRFLKATT